MSNKYIDMTPAVYSAIKAGTPVVAIETGFIMKLPYPRNLTAMQDCEEAFWKRDCVPCLMALIDGRIKVGLTKDDMEKLAQSNEVCTREDIPSFVALGVTAALDCSAAVAVARLIGIVPVAAPGISDSAADINALRSSRRLVFCGRLSHDTRTVFLSHGISVLDPTMDGDLAAEAYAVRQEFDFPESTVMLCGATLADLAERASAAAKGLRRRNNFA